MTLLDTTNNPAKNDKDTAILHNAPGYIKETEFQHEDSLNNSQESLVEHDHEAHTSNSLCCDILVYPLVCLGWLLHICDQ